MSYMLLFALYDLVYGSSFFINSCISQSTHIRNETVAKLIIQKDSRQKKFFNHSDLIDDED